MGHTVVEDQRQFPNGSEVTAYGNCEKYRIPPTGAPLPQFVDLGTATVKNGKAVIQDAAIIPGRTIWVHSEIDTDKHRWQCGLALASEKITLSGPSQVILAPSLNRTMFSIVNEGDQSPISLSIGGKDAVAGEGIVLQPNGGSWTLIGIEEGAGQEVRAAGSSTLGLTAF